jgi:hypothetical protein
VVVECSDEVVECSDVTASKVWFLHQYQIPLILIHRIIV